MFQPIITLDSCRPIGFEALSRFDLAPIRSPDVWFAEAAAVGLRADLELAAVERALRDLPDVPAHAYLAVNVSTSTAVSADLRAILRDFPAHRVVLEITEHDMIETYDQLEERLADLRLQGVRIAVDDAGAGYASFRHILSLKPDLIKLDISLTQGIDRDPARRALAAALITFAADTGSAIVAEGVERPEELQALRHLGVTAAQGYVFGQPAELSAVNRPKQTDPNLRPSG